MREKAQFYKKLFSLVLPIALQNLMSAIVSASDAVMLGFLNQDSLSAVSLATQGQFVLNLFFVALTIGATILAAQYWGKGDICAVEKVLGITTRFSLIISFVFFAAALGCPSLLMRIFTDEAVLIQLGIPYLRIVSTSYLFMGISQIYLCIMKNSGRTLLSTIYGSSAMVVNLILNAVLIFGLGVVPAMGIKGAAYATLLARLVELALVLIENCRCVPVRIKLSYILKADKVLQGDFVRYTLPMLMNELAWGCGFTMFSVIMGHLGSDAVAANSVANIVKNIIACVCLGIGTGSGIMVGNELGAGNLERGKAYGIKLKNLSFVIGFASTAVVLALTPLVVRIVILTEEAQQYLTGMMIIMAVYMIGRCVNTVTINGVLDGGGDTVFDMYSLAVCMWGIAIPLALLGAFVFHWPVLAVYACTCLDEVGKIPWVMYRFRKYKWVKDLTRNNPDGPVRPAGEE